MVNIRPAVQQEAEQITALALRSKAHWGYSQAFMDACHHELTITPEMIASSPVMVLETAAGIVGFYTLQHIDTETAEIGHLFIAPETIGQGYGEQLWQHALATAQATGYQRLQVESDPYAEGFYQRMGMLRYGERASTIFAGRVLPLLAITW